MLFGFNKRKGIFMCKKLKEIHNLMPEDFLGDLKELPVNINYILKKWNIDHTAVLFDSLQKDLPLKNLKITGLSYAKEDDLFILYSKKSTLSEARFTLAHELGHCCMHMSVDSSCHIELQTVGDVLEKTGDSYKIFNAKKEEEADKFARSLLIPTNALLLLLQKETNWTIKRLADFFVVPIPQMQKKLKEI